MANNNTLYNAAYDGALTGLASRWVAEEMLGQASTTRGIAAAMAFAIMLDSLIPAGSYNSEQSKLLTSLCESVWSGRMPLSDVPAQYENVAITVKGLFEASIANLLPGNDAGPIAKYTVGPAWTNAQYPLIQPALNAAIVDGHSSSTAPILVSVYPGNYDEAVVIPDTLLNYEIKGSDNSDVVVTSISATLPVNGKFLLDGISAGALTVAGDVDTSTLILKNNRISGLVSATGLVFLSMIKNVFAGAFLTHQFGVKILEAKRNICPAGSKFVFSNVGIQALFLRNDFLLLDGTSAVDDGFSTSEYYFNTFMGIVNADGAVNKAVGNIREVGNIWNITSGPRINKTGAGNVEIGVAKNIKVPVTGSVALIGEDFGGCNGDLVVCKTDGGGTVTLPDLTLGINQALPDGTCVTVKDQNGNATISPITIDGFGAQTIDGAATVIINLNRGAVTLCVTSEGGTKKWAILSKYL